MTVALADVTNHENIQMSWQLRRAGNQNLVCSVKGHLICMAGCINDGCNDTSNGHCWRCGALICIIDNVAKSAWDANLTDNEIEAPLPVEGESETTPWANLAGVEDFTDRPEDYGCPQ